LISGAYAIRRKVSDMKEAKFSKSIHTTEVTHKMHELVEPQ